jgi:hypothetical protein
MAVSFSRYETLNDAARRSAQCQIGGPIGRFDWCQAQLDLDAA